MLHMVKVDQCVLGRGHPSMRHEAIISYAPYTFKYDIENTAYLQVCVIISLFVSFTNKGGSSCSREEHKCELFRSNSCSDLVQWTA